MNPEFGAFEKNTKGIGMKLLLRMGYKPGEGLGKSGEGITEPIQAKLRSKQTGLGFDEQLEFEEGRMGERRVEKNELKEQRKERAVWKKRYYEEDVDLDINVLDISNRKTEKVTIIDMTRPESFGTRLERFPELRYNLNLIISQSQVSTAKAENIKLQNSRNVSLLQEELGIDSERYEKLERLFEKLQDFKEKLQKTGELSDEDKILEAAHGIAEDHQVGLQVALGLLIPLVKKKMSGWSPLEYPARPFDFFHRVNDSPLFDQIMFQYWLPVVRPAIVSEPISNPLYEFMDLWKDLIPASIMGQLKEQILIPKFVAAIESENDICSAHTWVHPWLPLFSDLAQIIPLIRRKISKHLDRWHPSDDSALELVIKWKPPVFSQSEFDLMLARTILPKLQNTLKYELAIDPANQDPRPLQWCLAWKSLIPTPLFITTLINSSLFNKLSICLHQWMTSPDCDLEEVSQWYLAWRGIFSDDLIEGGLMDKFNGLLVMMNSLIDDPSLPLSSFQL